MRKVSLKQLLLLSGFISMAALPAAIAASCGSSSTSPVSTTKIKGLKASTDSVHTSVKWPSATTYADPSVAKYQFYAGPKKTLAEVKTLPDASWLDALPTTAPASFDQRSLWVKISANSGYAIDNPYVDITTTSGFAAVKVRVDDLPEYAGVDLTAVVASGTLDLPVINAAAVVLPEGAKIVYTFKIAALGPDPVTFYSSENLVSYIRDNAGSIADGDKLTLKAHLESIDTTRFIVVADKEGVVDARSLSLTSTGLPTDLVAKLSLIKPIATSVHDDVSWTAEPTYPAAVKSVKFLSGTYATQAAAEAASSTNWQDLATIKAVDYDHSLRNLWAMVEVNPGYLTITNKLLDLSTTSQVREIKTLIDKAPGFTTIDLTKVEFSGSTSIAQINESTVTLPLGARISYNLTGETWQNKADFITYLNASQASITPSQFGDMKARLEATNSNLFVITDRRQATPKTDLLKVSIEMPAVITTYLSALRITPETSTHDNLVWAAATAPTLPQSISRLEYVSGQYAIDTDLIGVSLWSTDLPTATEYAKTSRHIWARVVPAAGYLLDNPYYEISSTSGVANVRTKVDLAPSYAAVNLSTIKVTGTASNVELDSSAVTLPTGAVIKYTVDSVTWSSAAELIQAIAATPLTSTTRAGMKARLAPMSADYVVVDAKTASLDASAIVLSISLPAAVTTYLNAIVPQVAATHDVLTWAQNSLQLPVEIANVEFLSGDYSTQALAEAASTWSTSLPTAIDYTHVNRHLWARVTAASGYIITNRYIDLTVSSTIQKVKSKIDAHPNYSNFDLSKIKLNGYTASHSVDESLAFTEPTKPLPVGAKIVYAWTDKYIGNKSATELQTFVNANIDTIYLSEATKLFAKLDLIDAMLFTVANDLSSNIIFDSNWGVVSDDLTTYFADVKVDLTVSTNDKLIWNLNYKTIPANLQNKISGFKILVGNYPSVTAPITPIAESSWRLNTPDDFVAFETAERFVWIRVELQTGWSVAANRSRYYDISGTTGVRSVVAVIDSAFYTTFYDPITQQLILDPAKIVIGGTLGNLTFNTSALAALPPYAQIVYSYGTQTNMTQAVFKTYIAGLASQSQITLALFNSGVKASFITVDATKYVLLNSHEAKPQITVA